MLVGGAIQAMSGFVERVVAQVGCRNPSAQEEGHEINWKIDHYDLGLNWHPPEPANPAVTTRVLTIMLAEEY
jgi:hypothetical protein